MAIDLRWTGYGGAAAQALHELVGSAKGGDALRPVTIVVPTNYVGVAVRRLLAGGRLGAVTPAGRGLAGVSLLTVYRLAELLGSAGLAAAGRRPVSTPVVTAAVRSALREVPGRFAPVADHPATERALVRCHRELSDVSASGLERLAAASVRAADVVGIHRAVRARLANGWYDEADLMAAAAEAMRAHPERTDELGSVILYLPQEISGPAARLLKTLSLYVNVQVLAGTSGIDSADRDVEEALGRLGLSAPKPEVAAPAVTTVISVSDPEDEVRHAVRRISAALRAGTALERMAVVYPHAQPYARLIHEQLRAAGIGYNGSAVRPLADRVAGRWLLDALELDERGLRRQDVLDLLAAAPVLTRSGVPVPTAAWERISRQAGVVRGRDDWERRLAGYAERCRAEADAVDEADIEARAEDRSFSPGWSGRRRRQADQADALRAFVAELAATLARGARLRSWASLTEWARALSERYLGDEPRRHAWPEAERRAADKVDAALDRLSALDAVEDEASLATFRRTLELELENDLDRVGRFGTGLLVGPLSTVLGTDLDLVIALGAAEGVLPTRVREDSLLPDAERAVVADELAARADRVHVQRRRLRAALAAASQTRVLCYPRGDLRRSVERPYSRWLDDHLEAGSDAVAPDAVKWETSRSFAASIAVTTWPATDQEYRMRALAGRRAAHRIDDDELVRDDRALSLGLALLRARRSAGFTRFDGNLAGVADLVPLPTGDDTVTSPTALETWMACPHRYLMQRVLRVGVIENPEELLELSPLELGNLVHETLQQWLEQSLVQGAPPPNVGWPPHARALLAQAAAARCDEYEQRGLTGHDLLWRRDRERLRIDFERFLEHEDRRRAELGVAPVAAELSFGRNGGDPVRVELGDGRIVRFTGQVDRLDTGDGGRLVVTDYKTGSHRSYTGLSSEDPLLSGTKLQLPVYGLAALAYAGDPPDARVCAEYWFVRDKHQFRRIGYEIDAAVIDTLKAALRVVADGIGRGLFPARPAEPGWRQYVDCDYCDPDGLGTAVRWRDWARKRRAPELAAYVGLVEPDVLERPEVMA